MIKSSFVRPARAFSGTLRERHRVSKREIAARGLAVLAVLAISFWLLAGQTQGLDPAHVLEAAGRIPMTALLASLGFCGVSLCAVAAYDKQAFRALRLPIPKHTFRAGFATTAISQTLGFGLIIGSLVRWRFYASKGTTLPQAAALTGLISFGFLACLAYLLGISTLITGQSLNGITISPMLLIVLTLSILALSLLQPSLTLGARRLAPPTLPILGRFMSLTLIDVSAAALALWILLPAEMRPEFTIFAQIFLLSLGFGMISSAPGGVGVFEVTCLMLLKDVPQAELLSAILVFRALYYALPFLLGAAILLEAERTRAQAMSEDVALETNFPPHKLVQASFRAEAALAYLGDKEFVSAPQGSSAFMLGSFGSSLVALGAPLGDENLKLDLLHAFKEKADAQGLSPVVYKAPQEVSDAALRHGWNRHLLGEEAVLDPQDYAPGGKPFRELTRKLKQARAAGVEVEHYAPRQAPYGEMQAVASLWKTRHDECEMGFSQGRYVLDFVKKHDVLVARHEGQMIAFISLWKGAERKELSLDLMRSLHDLPQGTMHLLVHEAILLAKGLGSERFSLCAVQLKGLEEETSILGRLGHWFYLTQNDRHHLQGLTRFKNAFRPNWEPRYLLTRSKLPPLVTLWDIHRLVRA